MVILYYLSLASKSTAVYDDIWYNQKQGLTFLILPSRWCYKNYIRPKRRFNNEIISELLKKNWFFFFLNEKFFVLLMDEMKVQENLVWEKHTGELIGYVDLGDINANYGTF